VRQPRQRDDEFICRQGNLDEYDVDGYLASRPAHVVWRRSRDSAREITSYEWVHPDEGIKVESMRRGKEALVVFVVLPGLIAAVGAAVLNAPLLPKPPTNAVIGNLPDQTAAMAPALVKIAPPPAPVHAGFIELSRTYRTSPASTF
jgi:hypothetical protein